MNMWIVNRALYRSDNRLPFDKSNYQQLFKTSEEAEAYANDLIPKILYKYHKGLRDMLSCAKPFINANAINFTWRAKDLVSIHRVVNDVSIPKPGGNFGYKPTMGKDYMRVDEEFEFTGILSWEEVNLPDGMENALKLMGLF
jgi:hypothetical protein